MRKLAVFNHVSLDGYFVDEKGSMTWAKGGHDDAEWNAWVSENASADGTLLFGRKTYELMTSYWPTPMARQHDAVVADRMNSMPKFVFSRQLNKALWNNTTLVNDDAVLTVRKMKQEPGLDMVVLGSGILVSQLAQAGLVDQFQIVVNPIILGKGRTMFEGVRDSLALKLTKSRAFGNGNLYICYEAAA